MCGCASQSGWYSHCRKRNRRPPLAREVVIAPWLRFQQGTVVIQEAGRSQSTIRTIGTPPYLTHFPSRSKFLPYLWRPSHVLPRKDKASLIFSKACITFKQSLNLLHFLLLCLLANMAE